MTRCTCSRPRSTTGCHEGHLCRFVSELVDEVLDLEPFLAAYTEQRGYPPYDPRLMVKLLVYGYITGVRSSRAIERSCTDSVPFRFLAANQAPDFRSIARFRQRHLQALRGLFVESLELCQQAGMVRLGRVALDGTKRRANVGQAITDPLGAIASGLVNGLSVSGSIGRVNEYITSNCQGSPGVPTTGTQGGSGTSTSVSGPPTTTAAAAGWTVLTNTSVANNSRILITTDGNGNYMTYSLYAGGAGEKITPSVAGAQINNNSSDGSQDITPFLTAPAADNPDGLIVFWIEATVLQNGLTPAQPVSKIEIYNPDSGTELSATTVAVPAGAQMNPEFANNSLVSGVLDTQDSSGNAIAQAIAFSTSTGSILWKSRTAADATNYAGWPDGFNDATLLLLPAQNPPTQLSNGDTCDNDLQGVDAVTGKVLFEDTALSLTYTIYGSGGTTTQTAFCPDSAASPSPLNPADPSEIQVDEGGPVINATTGAVVSLPLPVLRPSENSGYFFDGRYLDSGSLLSPSR